MTQPAPSPRLSLPSPRFALPVACPCPALSSLCLWGGDVSWDGFTLSGKVERRPLYWPTSSLPP